MPELPDVQIYVERLDALATGHTLEGVRLASPFVLRTTSTPAQALHGRRLVAVERLGKRIVLTFENDFLAVIHLMIAGRLRWKRLGAVVPKTNGLAAFDFDCATLLFTEAAKKSVLHCMLSMDENSFRASIVGGWRSCRRTSLPFTKPSLERITR